MSEPARPPSEFKLPDPVYPCADRLCAQQYSFPAKDLTWCIPNTFYGRSHGSPGFYCHNCIDGGYVVLEPERHDGITLAEELERRDALNRRNQ